MAITKTRTVSRIEVYNAEDSEDIRVMVVYDITFDDSNDDTLPVTQNKVVHLQKNTVTVDNTDPENPVETTVATNISAEDELVQTVCNAVWA